MNELTAVIDIYLQITMFYRLDFNMHLFFVFSQVHTVQLQASLRLHPHQLASEREKLSFRMTTDPRDPMQLIPAMST